MRGIRLATVVATILLIAAAVPVSVVATQQASASVGDYTVTRGDTVSITATHSADAILTIGTEDRGFAVDVPLDGTGTTTVKFNTYRTTSANPNAFISVDGASLQAPADSLNSVLSPGQYRLTVTIDGSIEAAGTLDVTRRSEMSSTVGRLPSTFNVEDATTAEIYDRIDNGSSFVQGETVALNVTESGLEGVFDEEPSAASLAAEGVEVHITEQSPEPNTDGRTYTDSELRIRPQLTEHDRFLVLWNTSSIELRPRRVYTYEVKIILNGNKSPLVARNETLVSERLSLERAMIQLDATPGFTLPPWGNETMTLNGKTNLAPGTSLSVKILQETPQANFWDAATTVSANGTFTPTFDLSDATRPGRARLWIEDFGHRTDYSVRFPAATASLLFPSQTPENSTIDAVNVSLSAGGFIQVTAENTTVGASTYLSSGTHGSVAIPLTTQLAGSTNMTATAIVDANGNKQLDETDPAYRVAGTPVADTATIELPASTATATATQPATTTQPSLHVNQPLPLTPAKNQQGTSGGFAPLSLLTALIAIAAALLLGVWRRR